MASSFFGQRNIFGHRRVCKPQHRPLVGGAVARHPRLPLHIEQLFYPGIGLIALPQRKGDLKGPVDGHMQLVGHHFSDLVHLAGREYSALSPHPAGRPVQPSFKGHDLGHMILPVFKIT